MIFTSGSRRLIDTRTFTRIKRRSNNKLNFDNAESTASPDSVPSTLSNIWKNQLTPESEVSNINIFKFNRKLNHFRITIKMYSIIHITKGEIIYQ